MSKQVFSYAAARLSPEQAKDVTNSTFEVVWRKRHDVPADPSEWPAWIFGVAKNQVLQEMQRVRRKHHDNRFVSDTSPVEASPQPDIADVVAVTDSARRIWRQLTPAEQQLLNLAFLGDLDNVSASRLLGISVTAYTTRVTRLRQRIAALVAHEDASDVEVGLA
jgi:RNA polymerase sigma factor (sigma-70 family)